MVVRAGPPPAGGRCAIATGGPAPSVGSWGCVTIRVLLCDDQAVWRAGLRSILEDEPDIQVVGEASDGETAIELARRLRPDLILMDLRMPRLDGVQATLRLAGPKAADPLRVTILTIDETEETVLESLRAGAIGYLLKDMPCEELLDAVRVTAAGGAVLAPPVTKRLLDRFSNAGQRASGPRGLLDQLTRREWDVLALVAQGMLNHEIAEALSLRESTVKSHVSHILGKLGLHDRAQMVVLAYQTGLAQPGQGEPLIGGTGRSPKPGRRTGRSGPAVADRP
jgi:DNA-binding NarL/FixJ family response regulator